MDTPEGKIENSTELGKDPQFDAAKNRTRDDLTRLMMQQSRMTPEQFAKSALYQREIDRYLDPLEDSYHNALKNGISGEKALQDLTEILGNGKLHGLDIPSRELPGRYSGIQSIMEYRLALMKIYSVNPELAEFMLQSNIIGGHGSNSSSLMGAAEYGLIPPDDILDKGGFIFSGEGLSDLENAQSSGLQDQYTCFTKPHDWSALLFYSKYKNEISEKKLENAIDKLSQTIPEGAVYSKTELNEGGDNYSKLRVLHQIEHLKKTLAFLRKGDKTEDEKMQEDLLRKSFNVVYFIGGKVEEGPNKGNYTIPGGSIESQYWVRGGTPKEMIKLVLVPEAQVKEVQKLAFLKGLAWKVEPIEPYQEVFR